MLCGSFFFTDPGVGGGRGLLRFGNFANEAGGGGGLGLVSGGPVFGHVGLWSPKRGLPRLGGLAPASNWYNGLVGPPPLLSPLRGGLLSPSVRLRAPGAKQS